VSGILKHKNTKHCWCDNLKAQVDKTKANKSEQDIQIGSEIVNADNRQQYLT